MSIDGCLDCGRGFCDLCGEHSCCIAEPVEIIKDTPPKEKRSIGRPVKENPDEIRDKHSTGRKRAAMLYPISENSPCEWKSQTNCGGGKFPIIGCIDGKQQHRHHGPDKNTLNNAPSNVHRICDDCHNIWHSQNDRDYDPALPHSPRAATNDELADRALKVRYCA